jgi:hypothetical protein
MAAASAMMERAFSRATPSADSHLRSSHPLSSLPGTKLVSCHSTLRERNAPVAAGEEWSGCRDEIPAPDHATLRVADQLPGADDIASARRPRRLRDEGRREIKCPELGLWQALDGPESPRHEGDFHPPSLVRGPPGRTVTAPRADTTSRHRAT